MPNFLNDLSFAARTLRANPGFTLMAALTLGLGIAANTTVFGWINTVLLDPIPGAAHSREIAALEAIAPNGNRVSSCPHPDFRDFQRELRSASGVAAAHLGFFNIGSGDRAARVLGQVVSANYFEVLGVRPFRGRVLLPEEDRDEQGAFPIAIISHGLWRTYFGGSDAAIGSAVQINGHTYTVVGVTPPDFRGTVGGAAMDVWVPLSMVIQTGTLNTWAAADRNARFLDIIVRLKSGTTVEQGSAEVAAVAARIAAAYPETHKGVSARLVPFSQAAYGLQPTLRAPLRILMFVCVLAMLIACVNVANLLTARCVTRRREFAVRIALGARRTRIIRQLLAESLLIAGAGAAAGIVLAQWFGDGLYYVLPAMDPTIRAAIRPLLQTAPSGAVLAFAILISTAAAVLATVMPALTAHSVGVNDTLKDGGRSGTEGVRTRRGRAALVIAEVALASVALIGAGIAVRSFQKLSGINPGFDRRNVLVAQFHLSTNGYSLEKEKEFGRNLRLRLAGAAAVEQAASTDSVPLSIFSPPGERVQIDEAAGARQGVLTLRRAVVTPGYFALMRIPLLAGRDFTDKDTAGAPRVIIVNETFARRYFPGKDPLGRKVRVSGRSSTIIGMVADSKWTSPAEPPAPFFYGPMEQIFFSGHNNFLCLRADNPDAARSVLRREVASLDGRPGLYTASPLAEYTEAGLFSERVTAGLLAAVAILSLLLAGMGLYSVMGYTVSERLHEIGIRMALGAQRGELLGMILWNGLAIAGAGIGLGIVLVVMILRVLKSMVELPLEAREPLVYGVAAAFLLSIAVAASYLPARRATKVDPLVVLRAE